MGNLKLYAFQGTIRRGGRITADDVRRAFRASYATLEVDERGCAESDFNDGRAWCHGSVVSSSMVAAESGGSLLRERCDDYALVSLDLDQAEMGAAHTMRAEVFGRGTAAEP